MRYFLGVDGGQSSTTALIADETGQILGAGQAGPCNHVKSGDGREKFTSAILESVGGALRAAGLTQVTFEAACLGLSGGPEDKAALAGQLVSANLRVCVDDAVTALAGATGGAPGIVTIAGTGSIARGRNAQGHLVRAGGWGYVFGDEGSAFDIVRGALRAMLRHEEGWGPSTALTSLLLNQGGGARGANELMHRFYTGEFPRSRVAALAPLVDQAAREGDGPAREILMGAAQSLATITAAVRRQLFSEGEPALVYYVGGVFRSDLVRQRFEMLVELAGCRALPPLHGPAQGALLEAFRLAGHPIAALRP